jgi:hypothetical protein
MHWHESVDHSEDRGADVVIFEFCDGEDTADET